MKEELPVHFICKTCRRNYHFRPKERQRFTCMTCDTKYEIIPIRFKVSGGIATTYQLCEIEGNVIKVW